MTPDVVGETLYMVAGETKVINLTVLDEAGDPADLTDATAKFAIEGLLLDNLPSRDCTIANNVISVTINSDDTEYEMESRYEFRVKDSFDQVDSLVKGNIVITDKIVPTMEV